jgi:hypothetical protein
MAQKGFKKTKDRIRLYLDVRLHDVPERERERGAHGAGDPPPPESAGSGEFAG